MNEDDNLVFTVGVVIVLVIAIGVLGLVGPFVSDWILK